MSFFFFFFLVIVFFLIRKNYFLVDQKNINIIMAPLVNSVVVR